MAAIKHKDPTLLLIFQIYISQNPGMCIHGQFSKIRSHLVKHFYNISDNDLQKLPISSYYYLLVSMGYRKIERISCA